MNAAKAPEVSQGWRSLVAGFKSLPVEEISMSTEDFSVPTILSLPDITSFVALRLHISAASEWHL